MSSFSRSSFFSCRTISASASVHSHSLPSGITHREAGGRGAVGVRGREGEEGHLDGYGSTEVSRGESAEFGTANPPLPPNVSSGCTDTRLVLVSVHPYHFKSGNTTHIVMLAVGGDDMQNNV